MAALARLGNCSCIALPSTIPGGRLGFAAPAHPYAMEGMQKDCLEQSLPL